MNQAISSTDIQSLVEQNIIDVVIPAAGVGKRMGADRPKQYLDVNGSTILAHTVNRLCQLPYVRDIILVISDSDEYFHSLQYQSPFNHSKVRFVIGGKERADSVLAGIQSIVPADNAWVLVHDGARPNIALDDVDRLVYQSLNQGCGGILATPVKDTIKLHKASDSSIIERTVPRNGLYHALTPQFFPVALLISAIQRGLTDEATITDEASALEHIGQSVLIVEGRSDNIKVTQPEDLALIRFYLQSS